jgi:hypothetical protein
LLRGDAGRGVRVAAEAAVGAWVMAALVRGEALGAVHKESCGGRGACGRSPARPKLDPFVGIIEPILEDDSQQAGVTVDALQAVCDLDLTELQAIDRPRGFGRD